MAELTNNLSPEEEIEVLKAQISELRKRKNELLKVVRKDEINEYYRNYRRENAEKIRQIGKKCYEKNKEKRQEYGKNYYRNGTKWNKMKQSGTK